MSTLVPLKQLLFVNYYNHTTWTFTLFTHSYITSAQEPTQTQDCELYVARASKFLFYSYIKYEICSRSANASAVGSSKGFDTLVDDPGNTPC